MNKSKTRTFRTLVRHEFFKKPRNKIKSDFVKVDVHNGMLTNAKYELRTPNAKSFSLSNAGDFPNYILMDEYGQTPDHFYLAANAPKSQNLMSQVKRRLNLDTSDENVVLQHTRRGGVNGKSVEKQRFDTSLGHLTKKFVEVLANSPDGVINLNRACHILSVPKRRIYDITNVLEGAGLLEKTSRNNIQWKGKVPAHDHAKYELESDIDQLESKENQLDLLINNAKAAIKILKNEDEPYAFVMYEDVKKLSGFENRTLIGIKAHPDTLLEAHEDYKIRLKSRRNEISAYLLSEESMPEVIENVGINEKDAKDCNNEVDNSATGDLVLKRALIEEEDDLAPLGKNFLLQTEDQLADSTPFLNLEPHDLGEYSFILNEAEGISDLFDTCEFNCS